MSAAVGTGPVAAWVWAVFAVTIALDVLGQTAFKLGLASIPASRSGRAFWIGVVTSPPIVAGVAGYALEAFTWMVVLGHAPMSVVGPMAALSYVGAVVAGRLFLRERVARVRAAGATLVAIGSALLASTTR